MTITINGTTGIAGVDGSASTPAVQGTDTNTGIFFPAADTIAFGEGGAESMRIDSSGNVGIGTTSPTAVASYRVLQITGGSTTQGGLVRLETSDGTSGVMRLYQGSVSGAIEVASNLPLTFLTNSTEKMRITSSGLVGIGCIPTGAVAVTGITLGDTGWGVFTRSSDVPLFVNRQTNDGTLVEFRQDNTLEGTISVSGTTVSYNGGNLSRWAQMPGTKDDTLVKGTVMSNLDEMNVYTDAEGNPVENEQLNKVKVSDVEGDVNVAGVFVNWTYDDAHQVDEINMAMTGDMIIRIAQGVVVQKGDLLMSAGDGTAKPQGDDIVRSKTVAKVTSNHVTCTYADGSYCVPCVLMAC
jgi:hypothetical protein